MASINSTTFYGLPKRDIASLKAIAKSLGLTPDGYAKRVIKDAIAFERAARASKVKELLRPFRDAFGQFDEAEFDRLVDEARTYHHQRTTRKKR
jgi:hypothetical protein